MAGIQLAGLHQGSAPTKLTNCIFTRQSLNQHQTGGRKTRITMILGQGNGIRCQIPEMALAPLVPRCPFSLVAGNLPGLIIFTRPTVAGTTHCLLSAKCLRKTSCRFENFSPLEKIEKSSVLISSPATLSPAHPSQR